MPTIHDHHASMFGLAHHAALYERLARRLTGRLFARVIADVVAAELPPHARVLDVGTGPGRLPLQIAVACPHLNVDAVDLAPEMVEQARHTAAADGHDGAVTFAVADVAHLPYPDATFDIVVSTLSQHHWADPRAGLRELERVLRPGGQAWIYDVRWALRRAHDAARSAAPLADVARESPLLGTSRLSPIGRVVVRTVAVKALPEAPA